MKLLEMKNVRKTFGELEVLKDISCSVDEGEIVSIIGPSGSGKSTLLALIATGATGTATELADAAGVDPRAAFHVLRHLAANGRVDVSGVGLDRVFTKV